jgi:hypothetical protein
MFLASIGSDANFGIYRARSVRKPFGYVGKKKT